VGRFGVVFRHIVGIRKKVKLSRLLEDIKKSILPQLSDIKAIIVSFRANSNASTVVMDDTLETIVQTIPACANLVVSNSIDNELKDGYIEYQIICSGKKEKQDDRS